MVFLTFISYQKRREKYNFIYADFIIQMRPPMGSPGFGPRPGPYSSNTFPGPRPGFPGPRHPSSQAGPLPPQSPSTSAPVPSHMAGPPRPMVPPQRPHVSLGQEPQHEQVRVKLVKYGVSFSTSKKRRAFLSGIFEVLTQ